MTCVAIGAIVHVCDIKHGRHGLALILERDIHNDLI